MPTNSSPSPRLPETEVQSLLARYSQCRDLSARECIVLQYTSLVESIARRFTGSGEPVEDLAQEGYIGLITAVDLFDASKKVKFSTYATHFIIGQIKHYLRDKGKIIKEPAWLQELNQRMSRVIESLTHSLGRAPSDKEVGDVMGLPEDTVTEILTTRELFKVSSLDAGTEREDSNGYPVDTDKVREKKCTAFHLPPEDKIVLETAMDRLKSIEQRVIHEFFYRDLNQTEIAKKLGISCNYVSHILRNSTKKLRRILQTEEIRDAQIQVTQMSKRLQEQSRALEQVTVVDQLTGAYNKSYFLRRLDEEISRSSRHGHSVAVVLVKIDTPVSLGRLTRMIRADDVMIAAADRIRTSVRKADVVTRYDQDIFALILPHTGEYSTTIAHRLQKALTASPLQLPTGSATMEVGVQTACAHCPGMSGSRDQLVETVCDALSALLRDDEQQPRAA